MNSQDAWSVPCSVARSGIHIDSHRSRICFPYLGATVASDGSKIQLTGPLSVVMDGVNINTQFLQLIAARHIYLNIKRPNALNYWAKGVIREDISFI